jgi:hypothetical protein
MTALTAPSVPPRVTVVTHFGAKFFVGSVPCSSLQALAANALVMV